ncbi:ABC transporter ATP-binding protein [Desulfurivibrio alkaliphilus]|uniref:ABC transporter related protein n=1 Tax=Desulfurivibrio alkaliphilus (strain DSM 19089 / UNIQEM U267 / AHT2) TaxID=589865 RepID=D6Z5D5_DESAT|nr:ABC transporter ATP-binding protein [Desulfurivibrio alkaliphilus]ADH84792.1 ABC transporter related protein [Desulfurivibrio alkaliphilus AHT 2]
MIKLKNVEKKYRRGAEEVRALRGIDLEIQAGEFVSVIGPSGAGKTTLLHILGCLDLPSSGEMHFDGLRVDKMRESELVTLRRNKIGFIFQQFYLIPGLSVLDNIALPLMFSKSKPAPGRIEELARAVGLGERLHHVPAQLSGGEMQRTAIARALVNDPEVILADEPTGNLDSANSEKIFDILHKLHQNGLTVIMITHNPELAERAGRTITIKDGIIEQ